MDLVEVEGLADLLRAQTAVQRRLAMNHLLGEASSVFEAWRKRLQAILAHAEAAVDFAEEEGVAEAALRDIAPRIRVLSAEMGEALHKSQEARAIREGVRVVLAGRPNTGKSSLLNALARREAAIVSSKPGTTRDVIEVQVNLGGIPVILLDTAGLRDLPLDEIEEIGIGRTRREAAGADVVVWVSASDIPGSLPPEDGLVPDLRVHTKSDLAGAPALKDASRDMLVLSSRTGAGMGEFLDRLSDLVRSRYGGMEAAVITRTRQQNAIQESIRHLNNSLGHRAEHLELAAEDLRNAAHALARITGRIEVEDLLELIFAEFCIGK
jgi:tRNA modification GTPase